MEQIESKISQVLRSLIEDRMITSGLKVFRAVCRCGRQAAFLCDWKVSAHRTGTCDVPICTNHDKQPVPGKHLCQEHQRAYDAWKRRRATSVPIDDGQQELFA